MGLNQRPPLINSRKKWIFVIIYEFCISLNINAL